MTALPGARLQGAATPFFIFGWKMMLIRQISRQRQDL